MKPYLSIIIPTYNRAEKLEKTLAFLHEQNLSQNNYDIWVVDDGSTDTTQRVLQTWSKKSPLVHILKQKNQGQGVARNHALKRAPGEIVLFMGDDIYATPNFLLKHVEFHQQNPKKNWACLGLTKWAPQLEITAFMEWLVKGGPQFAYDELSPGKEASFWFFYTSNVSVKKALLKEEVFDPDFKGYGWEDIELAYRLTKQKKLQVIYTPEALAFHDHFMKEEDLKKKMLAIGSTARIFQKKHPHLVVIPRGIKHILLSVLSSTPILFLLKIGAKLGFKNMYWYALSKHYFLQGIK